MRLVQPHTQPSKNHDHNYIKLALKVLREEVLHLHLPLRHQPHAGRADGGDGDSRQRLRAAAAGVALRPRARHLRARHLRPKAEHHQQSRLRLPRQVRARICRAPRPRRSSRIAAPMVDVSRRPQDRDAHPPHGRRVLAASSTSNSSRAARSREADDRRTRTSWP